MKWKNWRKKVEKKKWTKKCPECGEEQSYSAKSSLISAIKNNRKCKSCSKSGKNNPCYDRTGRNNPMYGRTGKNHPMYGKHHTEKTKKKQSKSHIGNHHTTETKRKQSKSKMGRNNPMYGRCAYDIWVEKYGIEEANRRREDTIRKMRASALNRIEKNIKNGGQVKPNYNPNSILIMDALSMHNDWKLQHAEKLSWISVYSQMASTKSTMSSLNIMKEHITTQMEH